MSDTEKTPAKAPAKSKAKSPNSDQSPVPTRYERNLDAEINPKDHDGGGPTEADTSDGSVHGDSNRVVALNASTDDKPAKLPEPAKSVPTEDAETNNVEAKPDSTARSVEEKRKATLEAIDYVARNSRTDKYGEPEGAIIRQGEEFNIKTEKNKYGQEIAAEDTFQEHEYDGSERKTYTQVAVKGALVQPWLHGAIV